MKRGSGSGAIDNARLDPAWKYCKPIPDNKNGIICNFCGLVHQSGGITFFKYHLSHTDLRKNSRKCSNVPPEVKQEIRNLLKMKDHAKQKKAEKMKEIREELRQGLRDEDEDEEDVFMYHADLDPTE
ncbi:hypothetical protein C2S53_004454 [Perilla frutescens var. hirtella]|uniref:BED-type domain-containing protein n=1 Tax=Perilla frutescens var. hirtella TaxID=608512 RepID=A0AAD4P1S2_PERFH|nr:hypothetical protein C2S53_004454 [Perilla frutescens var. hirtella]